MQVHEAPVDQSWQALPMRVERAESARQQLVALVETPPMNDEYIETNDDDRATQKQMDALEDQVQRVTRRARECIQELRHKIHFGQYGTNILAPLAAAAKQRQRRGQE
jgi:RNA polymerase-binding transcription factor DksA